MSWQRLYADWIHVFCQKGREVGKGYGIFMGEPQHLPPLELPGTSLSFPWGTTFHQQPKNLGGHPGTPQQHGLSPDLQRRHFGGSELWCIPGMDKSQSSPDIHHGGGGWNIVSLISLADPTGLMPLHSCTRAPVTHPFPRTSIWASYLRERWRRALPELLSSGATITTNEHLYMRIDIPPPPLEESECTTSPVDEVHTIPAVNSPKTSPKPRVSIAAEVNDLLTQVMADASSCKSKHSPIGKVTTVEAVSSPPWKSEASPQLVDTSSQAIMMEVEASLEGLPANVSPITTAYSSGSASPSVDPTELWTNANRAADNMLHLKRSTDLKRQRVIWELG